MFKFIRFLSIFIVVLELSSVLGGPQSSSAKCSMQDSECLTSEGQKLVRTFVDGIPESRVEKLDDMSIETIEIIVDGVDHELQNVKITGLKDAKINDISFDHNFNLMRLSFDANLTANFEYTLDGVLFRNPISGTGTATMNIKNIQVDMLILYDIIETENGKHRINAKRHRSGFTIKTGVEYDYSNLYNGDQKKNEDVRDVLNKNWVTITSLFGDSFYYKIIDTIFDGIKAFTISHDLEDFVSFP